MDHRQSYLFRMFSDEAARLEALAPRFGGKREALAAALLALEHQEAERMAESMEARSTVMARMSALEERVAALETTPHSRPTPGKRGPRVR